MAGAVQAGGPVPPDQGAARPEGYDRRWWILGLLCTSLVIVVVGNTSLNVALPTLQRELGASQTALQWMVDSYALVFAGLLLTAGAMGDRFGRKGALQAGLLIFGLACLYAALFESEAAVIGARAVMGVGAAFIMPATLSILTNVFPPEERAKAIAVWAGLSGAGGGIGPIASGWLLDHFSYGSVFYVNLPIVLAALVAGRWLLPTSKDPEQGRLDPVGALLSIVGLSTLLYAIIEGPTHGWASTETLLAFGAAVLVLALFAWWELRTDEPMLDLRFFRNPRFSVASGGITLVFFAMFGVFFLMTQFFQLVLGYSPLEAGVRQGPVALALIAVAPNSARLVDRFGARRVVPVGIGIVGTGLLFMALTSNPHTPYWQIALTMMCMASGMGLTVSPLTAAIMQSVPLGKAGVGSAVNDTTRELGGALGVAALGSLLASSYAGAVGAIAGLPDAARDAASSSLGAAIQVARSGQLPPPVAAALESTAKQAYVDGMRSALYVAAAITFVAAVLLYRFMPAEEPVAGRAPEPALAEGELAAALPSAGG